MQQSRYQQPPMRPPPQVQQVNMFGHAPPPPQRPVPVYGQPPMESMLVPDRRRLAVDASADYGRGIDSRLPGVGSAGSGSNHSGARSSQHPPTASSMKHSTTGSQASYRSGRKSVSINDDRSSVTSSRSRTSARHQHDDDDEDDRSSVTSSTASTAMDEEEISPDERVISWVQKGGAQLDNIFVDPTPPPPSVSLASSNGPEPTDFSGNEAVRYLTDKTFSVSLDVLASWPSRSSMKDPVYVVVPGKFLQSCAAQYAQAAFADELSQIEQYVPEMSLMRRWFPYRVWLEHSYSSNVPVGWGLRWENPVVRRHNARRWGVCDADYIKDVNPLAHPAIQQHNFLWLSPRHALVHDFRPAQPLLLSDLSAFTESRAFCQNNIDAKTEYDRSVTFFRVGTGHDQEEVRYMSVAADSNLARILCKDMTQQFRAWIDRGPQGPKEATFYANVPEPLCQEAFQLLQMYTAGFIGYCGLLNDQIFRVMPIDKSPQGYVHDVLVPGSVGVPEDIRPSAPEPALPLVFDPGSGQNHKHYVIPCTEYAQAEVMGALPAEICVRLRLDICPAQPLSAKEAELLGSLSVANLQKHGD